MKTYRSFVVPFGAVLGLVAALSFSPLTAQAPANPGVGVVDEDKLAEGFKKYSDAVGAVDKLAQSLDSKIPAREFLPEAEGKRFDALMQKPTPAAADTKELDALVKTGLAGRAEYMALVGKADRSAAENTRMGALQTLMTRNGPALQELSQKLLTMIRTQQETVDKDYTNRANSVVGQVAAEKKLMLIVRKKALVWSADSVDITGEVLARLNKA